MESQQPPTLQGSAAYLAGLEHSDALRSQGLGDDLGSVLFCWLGGDIRDQVLFQAVLVPAEAP